MTAISHYSPPLYQLSYRRGRLSYPVWATVVPEASTCLQFDIPAKQKHTVYKTARVGSNPILADSILVSHQAAVL